MKRVLSLGLAFLAVHTAVAVSSLPFYEPFPSSYGNGTLMGAGATAAVWDFGNSGTSLGAIVTNNAALTRVGLVGSNSYGLLITGTPSATRNRAASFTAQTFGAGNPVLYASFLVNVQTPPAAAANRLFAGLSSSGSGTSLSGVCGVWVDSARQLFISKNSASTPAATNTAALASGTHLVVLRYQWNAGTSDDTVSLWVDPSALGVAEGSVPAPDLATASGSDVATIQSFGIFHPATASLAATLLVDEIRVGTNWAQVTPTDGSTPPVTSNQPQITQSFLSAGALILRGTNGASNGVYQVLSSTSAVSPMGNWASIATNLFDANGNFDATNLVSPGTAQRFYRILVGGAIVQPPGTPPELTTMPTNLTVLAGQSAAFYGAATGTTPLTYQWFFNTTTPISGATSNVFSIASAQESDEGAYSLRVTNSAGAVTSVVATLTVNTPPSITTQPANQGVIVSNTATFTVVAAGDAPLRYQWYFNTNTVLANATNASYSIASALTNNSGVYAVVITNNFGAVTSGVATLTVATASTNPPNFNLFGFAQATTGGGQIPETDAAYVKVYTPLDFANAVRSANKTAGSVKVIEIMNDLNLGWNEIGAEAQALDSNPMRAHAVAKLHPVLITSGVSFVDIKSKSGLTIFSASGATIRHANFNIKDTSNIIIRNLKFAEMWEWDEATKGDYDSNDWDFITIGNGGGTVFNVWIDHCTFTKAYDGACDMKGGCYNITFSWNKYMGDDGVTNPNSFVRQQLNLLEANPSAYPMYNFLRTHGFSFEDIATISQGHDKTHLIGATSLNAENAQHAVTFHHQWYLNPWDRLPRLRAGNVHNYNIYVDDVAGLAAQRLRNARVAAMSPTDQIVLDGSPTKDPVYKFKPFLNGSIATEDGAVLVEKSVYVDCVTPLRNNQTDPNDPTYTGKILALDTIYHFDNADTTTIDYRGSSTNAPGNTYLGPVQAAVKPFSWNGFSSLPYAYVMDDPASLPAILSDPNYGAGAGVLSWAKTNWLKTTY